MKPLAQHIKRPQDFLWSADIGASSALRTVYAAGRDLGEGQLTLRAMSLHSL